MQVRAAEEKKGSEENMIIVKASIPYNKIYQLDLETNYCRFQIRSSKQINIKITIENIKRDP